MSMHYKGFLKRAERFVKRNKWTGAIVVALAVVVWKAVEFRFQSISASLERVKVEKELYERIQILQNEGSTGVLQYLTLRDQYFRLRDQGLSEPNSYLVQNEYNAAKARLASLSREYNRLVIKLSTIEGRPPRFFVLPLPPLPPRNLKGHRSDDGSQVLLTWEPAAFAAFAALDPLAVEVANDLAALFKQHEHKYPSDRGWVEPNEGILNVSNLVTEIYRSEQILPTSGQ